MKASKDELYALARDARDSNDRVGAETYYEAILKKDPDGWEAPFYLVYYKVANTSFDDLSSNCEEYSTSLGRVFDLAQASCPDTDSFMNVAKEIEERTESLTDKILTDAYHYYPALSTSEELTSRVTNGVTMCLILAEAFDIYFPNGEMAADATELRKKGVQHYTDLTNKLEAGARVLASGDFERAFGSTIAKIKAFDPSYTQPSLVSSSSNSSTSSSGCYIATCVYGSYDCPEVWTLRRFRDYKLAETWYGRLFVKAYYAISPSIVKCFGKTSWFKLLWRGTLDRFVESLNNQGFHNSPYEDRNW